MIDESIYNNLLVELKRGTQILQVLSQMKRTQYGYSLLQTLEEKNVHIDAGTLYPLLRRLESQGILKSEWDTTESRPRKYYVLSNDGEELFSQLKKEWTNMCVEMNQLLKEEQI
ncbi:MAG: PadR family transcriptional regulator [Bacillota bacterium]|nr:MAG: PadR family transcriptional regulator [Bacillota bacterium]